MQRVYRMAQLVAPRTTTVLIVGPTGSGKELMARALHKLSTRSARPFVAVNCAAIPEALFSRNYLVMPAEHLPERCRLR